MITGFGIVFFPFGGYLFGHFLRNKLQGLGILTFPNGDLYAGAWEGGKLEGSCICKKKGVWNIKKGGIWKDLKEENSIESQKVKYFIEFCLSLFYRKFCINYI